MEAVVISGNLRADLGKKSSKATRTEGHIPCVIYGGKENVHFSTLASEVKNLVYTPNFKVAQVNVNGKTHKCILKAVQYHPVSEAILHIDFLELAEGKPVRLDVPIRFKGDSPGVKAGGKLQQSMRRVKIKTTPENMVDELYADISSLQLGQAIRVRDLEIPKGIEVMNAGAIPIGTIEVPRALRGGGGGGDAATPAKK